MAEVERMASWNSVGLIFVADRSFLFIAANSKARRRLVVMGRGSATLDRVLMANKLQRSRWTERDLLKAAQVMGAGTGPTKTVSWTKVVKKARTSEAGR